METKTFRAPIELKAADDGEPGGFTAVFSRFNVVDHDGDVTVPGAFTDGEEVRISYWGHRWQDLPVGRGVVHQDEEKAWVDGRFFLQTQAGKETYETVKALGDLQEWSYGFDVEDANQGVFDGKDVIFLRKLRVYEVSPVMLGAGIGTGTTEIKKRSARVKRAIAPHSTATTDAAWDGPGNVARLPNDAGAAAYRRMFAWVDPDGDPEVKSSYKFPHHMVGDDGAVGAANTRACSAGIAVLNGGRGGAAIPDADRQGVYSHLARHIRDADMEPPELKELEAEDGEGEAGDGKPSGVSPQVVEVQIELLELED